MCDCVCVCARARACVCGHFWWLVANATSANEPHGCWRLNLCCAAAARRTAAQLHEEGLTAAHGRPPGGAAVHWSIQVEMCCNAMTCVGEFLCGWLASFCLYATPLPSRLPKCWCTVPVRAQRKHSMSWRHADFQLSLSPPSHLRLLLELIGLLLLGDLLSDLSQQLLELRVVWIFVKVLLHFVAVIVVATPSQCSVIVSRRGTGCGHSFAHIKWQNREPRDYSAVSLKGTCSENCNHCVVLTSLTLCCWNRY